MVDKLNIILKNTTSGAVYAYVTGQVGNSLCLIQADGRTQYHPRSPDGTHSPLGVDCAIRLGAPGSTTTIMIPYLSAARVWFSIDQPLEFFLNPGPALVEPSVTNDSDANKDKVWGFCELTFNTEQLYANISYVDFVSIPIAMSLTNQSGQTQEVKGIPRDGLDTFCRKLAEQHAVDGAGWNRLIVKTQTGKNLRALSPNLGRVIESTLFNGYFEPYISQVWEKCKSTPLAVDTQSAFGTIQGTVSNEVLTFSSGSFSKPSTADIFSNSTGPFLTNTLGMCALTPRICAAFNRATLLSSSPEPVEAAMYYKKPICNHYARILHETNLDGRGYAFPYDDVTKSGEDDQSGSVKDPNPSLLTIVVGGEPPRPPINVTSHIRAEIFNFHHGVKTEVTSDVEAGHDVGWISNGDWIGFNNIDFGKGDVDTVVARVASGAQEGVSGQVQLRIDSPTATPVAGLNIQNTGGWQSWTTLESKMNRTVTGIHTVYLTFASDGTQDFVNVNWFTCKKHQVLGLISTTIAQYKNVAYFVNWAIYPRHHFPQDISANLLTHINYAFANIKPDGEVFLTDLWSDIEIHFPPGDKSGEPGNNVYGCIKQLFLLKKKNRHLKVLLSVGGWTFSGSFAGPASTPQSRTRFAQTAVQLVKDCGFDGIDIDWEYPADDGQARNFVDLLRELRAALDAYSAHAACGYRFLITVACPAGASNYQKLRIKEMDHYLDFWNLMAYDFAGSWDRTSGHQANIYKSTTKPSSTQFSADEAMNYYIHVGGVPPHKMVLGMPIYGRAFLNTDGPGEPYDGVGDGSWQPGIWDYKVLPFPTAKEHFDPAIIASWSQEDQGRRMMVTYDTPEATRHKADYIRRKGLGGAMWWETSADRTGDHSLIATVAGALGGGNLAALDQDQNLLGYPQSKYDNLRKGFPGEPN